jgi:hypothetical protein
VLSLRQLRCHQRLLLNRRLERPKTSRKTEEKRRMEELQERVVRMLGTLTFEQLEMVIKYAERLNPNAGSAFDNELVVLLEDEISAA